MSSGAAIPEHRRGVAPVEYHRDPGGHKALGCPNCRSSEQLVVDVEAEHVNAVTAWTVRGITMPEYRVEHEDVEAPLVRNDKIVRVRCTKCRWSYQGPSVFEHLREVE